MFRSIVEKNMTAEICVRVAIAFSIWLVDIVIQNYSPGSRHSPCSEVLLSSKTGLGFDRVSS